MTTRCLAAALSIAAFLVVSACASSDPSAPDPRCRSVAPELLNDHGFDDSTLTAAEPSVPGYPACRWRATIDNGSLTATLGVPASLLPSFSAGGGDYAACFGQECPDDAFVQTISMRAVSIDDPEGEYLIVRRDHWPAPKSDDERRERQTDLDGLTRVLAAHFRR